MSIETMEVGCGAELGFDDRELELLLHDHEWVDAEFAAIMTASGFGDRIIVDTEPRPLAAMRPKTFVRHRRSRELDARHRSSRVRSPPSRP